MNQLESAVKRIIEKHFSGLPPASICALDLYTHGFRESDFSYSGKLGNIQISDEIRISVMNELRELERMAKE